MRTIRILSQSWLNFCIGGFVGLALWGEDNNHLWLWLVILAIGELPYIVCKLILIHQYCKFRKEFVKVVDDYPSDKRWLAEKANRRKTSKFPFLNG